MESDDENDADWIDMNDSESESESKQEESDYYEAEEVVTEDDDEGEAGEEEDNDEGMGPGVPLQPPSSQPRIYSHVRNRERIGSSLLTRRKLFSSFVPSDAPISNQLDERFDARVYCSQFSRDGSLFYSANQDFDINLYNPLNGFASLGTIKCEPGRWTITDCDVAADTSKLIYSSIHDTIFLVNLAPFLSSDSAESSYYAPTLLSPSTKIEVIIGASNGLLYVLDIETNTILHRVKAHRDDVNAVTFADTSSNLLLSGSDDCTIKIWDRRSSLQNHTPAGVLPGHTEGITFLTTKARDGRTAVSNAKDQSMKLWDLRLLKPPSIATRDYSTGYDYRHQRYPSEVALLRTLIRCHYSPEQRYLYMYIYDPLLPSGGPIKTLTVPKGEVTSEEDLVIRQFTRMAGRDLTEYEREHLLRRFRAQHRTWQGAEGSCCVRDVAWNPRVPQVIASVWRGEEGGLQGFEYQC
ncbi:WD40 repeat-like protein [Rhizoclosmatium globosum]|uniref:WD40 repeat-like protein n=1 Tax=Rhizoclosmatium globosum TaxID=329046 RepID=A0A1Y2CS62_9FUNG|nr:WD40 repeat-like protein [Rhizoclosmatium globosum]|eukprot:ORY49807.1 WD40 repeat-like protein [Rhizoclosmatium globosum]